MAAKLKRSFSQADGPLAQPVIRCAQHDRAHESSVFAGIAVCCPVSIFATGAMLQVNPSEAANCRPLVTGMSPIGDEGGGGDHRRYGYSEFRAPVFWLQSRISAPALTVHPACKSRYNPSGNAESAALKPLSASPASRESATQCNTVFSVIRPRLRPGHEPGWPLERVSINPPECDAAECPAVQPYSTLRSVCWPASFARLLALLAFAVFVG